MCFVGFTLVQPKAEMLQNGAFFLVLSAVNETHI